MNQNNTEVFGLDSQYSTTRCVTRTPPVIVNNPEDKFESLLFLPENSERKAEGGLRTQGYFKHNQTEKPLISVITVVFNGVEYLEQTINSIIGQTYDNVEYIIIDGGSMDGTLDIIKKYAGQIDYWVSERDEGIYGAMNKGVSVASGQWLNFMNAGDWFYSDDIITLIGDGHADIDFIYGDHELRYPTFNTFYKALSLSEIWKGMVFSHQSLFVKRLLMIKSPFNTTKYKTSSDYNFISNIVFDKKTCSYYVNKCFSSVDMDGYSGNNLYNYIIENYKIAKKYNKSYYLHIYYLYKFISAIPKEFIKNNLSIKYVDSIRKLLKS